MISSMRSIRLREKLKKGKVAEETAKVEEKETVKVEKNIGAKFKSLTEHTMVAASPKDTLQYIHQSTRSRRLREQLAEKRRRLVEFKKNAGLDREMLREDVIKAAEKVHLEKLRSTTGQNRETRALLQRQLYAGAIKCWAEQPTSMKGVTKDFSVILTHGAAGSIGEHFDSISRSSGMCDPYESGVSSLSTKTRRDKMSRTTTFLRAMAEMTKTPPFSLLDIYSHGLRRIASGITWSEDDFTSLTEELLPLGAIHADNTFNVLYSMLKRKTRTAANRERASVSARPFCSDLLSKNGQKFRLSSIEHAMLAIWIMSAARFSSITGVSHADITPYKNNSESSSIRVTIWQDKVVNQRGRDIILTCNCPPPTNQAYGDPELSYCPPCEFSSINNTKDRQAVLQALTPGGWDALATKLAQPHHALRRRWAIEAQKRRTTPKLEREMSLPLINSFVGWAERSKMFSNKYAKDWQTYQNDEYGVYMESIKMNLILTAVEKERSKNNDLSRAAITEEKSQQLLFDMEEDSDGADEWKP